MRSLVMVLLLGCGNVESNPVDGGLGVDAVSSIDAPLGNPAFTLTVGTPNASAPLGGTNRVLIQITRSGGFTGAVTLAGVSPPAGLTITEGVIAAGASVGEVLV